MGTRYPDLIKITEMARKTPVRENIERYPDLIKTSEMARNTPLCEIIECALILGAGRYGSGEETRRILPKKKKIYFRFHNSWLVGWWSDESDALNELNFLFNSVSRPDKNHRNG